MAKYILDRDCVEFSTPQDIVCRISAEAIVCLEPSLTGPPSQQSCMAAFEKHRIKILEIADMKIESIEVVSDIVEIAAKDVSAV